MVAGTASTTAPYEAGVGSHLKQFLEDILPNIKLHEKLCCVFLHNGPGTVYTLIAFSPLTLSYILES